ncbi:HPr kinase/phosphorylase [Tabrizicola caldifontis]|uniref:HPr kinase/phosphorylase n=1 Tax=Tabrizicola caldifontis TaxID=2528036 RepID=UPI00108140B1|nr:HPr kinase/phosphatase C-terminal domain-containing protein [Rhodobacter sp. YIM 73028]
MSATILHASCISVDGRGLLILGPSGSGKSSLALRLMALGARLVADDRTEVVAIDNRLIARCPPAIRGLVEARGVGLLRAETSGEVPVVLVADLGRTEEQRLPPYRRITLMGCELDLVLHPRNDHFPEALLLYLRNGRQA